MARRTLPKVDTPLNKFLIRNWRADLDLIDDLKVQLEVIKAAVAVTDAEFETEIDQLKLRIARLTEVKEPAVEEPVEIKEGSKSP